MTNVTDSAAAVILVPGQSIGPIRIGMMQSDLSHLGLDVRPEPTGQLGKAVRIVGPYQVVLDVDRVASISVKLNEMHAGIAVGNHVIPPIATIEQAAKAFPDCGQPEAREGGVVFVCGGGTTLVKRGSEEPSVVEIQVVAAGFLTP